MEHEDPDAEEQDVVERASSAVDRSRNLRQLIVLQRLLRELAAQRRRSGGDTDALTSH